MVVALILLVVLVLVVLFGVGADRGVRGVTSQAQETVRYSTVQMQVA